MDRTLRPFLARPYRKGWARNLDTYIGIVGHAFGYVYRDGGPESWIGI